MSQKVIPGRRKQARQASPVPWRMIDIRAWVGGRWRTMKRPFRWLGSSVAARPRRSIASPSARRAAATV